MIGTIVELFKVEVEFLGVSGVQFEAEEAGLEELAFNLAAYW